MRWFVAGLCLLFLYTGLRNLRHGDVEGARRLPVPRRLLGFFQLFVAVLLGGVVISLFTTAPR